ncbi:hypothetical protein [Glaciecola petra]|uniref:Uncharacterized protein n=1 Tax=Glaciecola petra TaxID=3075602 RepID=A0ABU2ZUQ5_9ALTE|nr:hypothetical protein [Aestuariibacter sp. P117]MDT0596049.1 hypothetical protein [Aestuariibacter sp. P117]
MDEWVLFQERNPESGSLVRFAGLKISSNPLIETDEYSQEWKVINTTSQQIMIDQDVISEYDISLSLNSKEHLGIGYGDFTLLLFRKGEETWTFSEYTNIQNRHVQACFTKSEFIHTFKINSCEWIVLPMIEDVPNELRIFQYRG